MTSEMKNEKQQNKNNINKLSVVGGDDEEVTGKEKLNREDLFIRNLSLCNSVQEAALSAGYAPQYASSGIYKRIKSPKFQEKVRQYYVSHVHEDLPRIARINRSILKQLEKEVTSGDLGNVPKTRHVSKQTLQIAGLLGQEKVAQPTVNVSGVRNMMIQLHNQNSRDFFDENSE